MNSRSGLVHKLTPWVKKWLGPKGGAIVISIIGVLLLVLSVGYAQTHYQLPKQSAPQSSRLEIPQDWTVYRGQSGLIIPHPMGWKIQEKGKGGFLAYQAESNAGAKALVLVQPIEKIEGQATGVVQGVGKIFPDLFPEVRVSKTHLASRTPEVAIAEIRYSPKNQPFCGSVMCFKENNRGVLYVIAANIKTWVEDEPVMKRILTSFFYSAGTPSGHRDSETSAPLPPMVTFRDPLEGAFTCPAPQGWKVDGGLKRFHAIDTRPEIVAASPDRRIFIRIGDSTIPPMTVPNQILQMGGFSEGSTYSPDGLLKTLVMRYMPATSFVTHYYLPKRVGRVSRVQTSELTDLSQQTQAIWTRTGMNVRVDTGEVTFETQTEGGPKNGYVFAQTVLVPLPGTPNAGAWYVTTLYDCLASSESEPTARTILDRMVVGFAMDPNWQAQQSRTTARVSQIWAQANNEISDIIHRTFEENSRRRDGALERWSRAFRGQVLIENPSTGERHEVPAGSNYYWQIGSGNEFIGTQTADPPHLPNHWVTQMQIRD